MLFWHRLYKGVHKTRPGRTSGMNQTVFQDLHLNNALIPSATSRTELCEPGALAPLLKIDHEQRVGTL